MRIIIKKRVLPFIVCFSILLSAFAYRPQRANAVALTSTAIVAASAAAILTACGVSYWAASQTDAIDYISGKLEDYLTSIEVADTPAEWLGVTATSHPFTVIAGGAMQFTSAVANKLLGFVRWFQNEEGIESGGSAVSNSAIVTTLDDNGYVGNPPPIISCSLENSVFASTVQGFFTTSYRYGVAVQFGIPINSPTDIQLTSRSLSGNGTIYVTTSDIPNPTVFGGTYTVDTIISADSSANYLVFTVYTSRTTATNISFSCTIASGSLESSTVEVTPSDFVNVPSNIAQDATFSVVPSVSLAEGDTVDDASQAIIDGITSQEGLTSEVEETPDTSWGWLYTLLVNIAEAITDGVSQIKQAVLGLADSVYSKFATVLQNINIGIGSMASDVVSSLAQVKQAVLGLADSVYAKFTQILQDVKTGINNIYNELAGIGHDVIGLPAAIAQSISNAFVPSADFADSFAATAYAMFDNHFSILSYPFSILGEFSTRLLTLGNPQPIFRWGNIKDPFSDKIVISAGQYNLNDALQNQKLAEIYDLYMLLVKAFISFQFINFLYAWFCDVFKMRESDYPLPFDDADGDSDVEDGDGYDGYYSSY